MSIAFEEALRAIDAEMRALAVDELRPLNVDVAEAAMRGLAAARGARRLLADVPTTFPEALGALIAKVELRSRALMCAHARQLVGDDGVDVATHSAQLRARRSLLKAEVEALVARRVLPANVTAMLVRAHGHRNVVFDVLQLVVALRTHWAAVSGKTSLTLAELDEAEGAAHVLATATAGRRRAPISPAADARRRAFTLFFTSYEELRRSVHYLRWYEGDADRIAPSLSGLGARRVPAKKKAAPAHATEPAASR